MYALFLVFSRLASIHFSSFTSWTARLHIALLSYCSDDDRNGVPTKKTRRHNSSVIHAYMSFHRGLNEGLYSNDFLVLYGVILIHQILISSLGSDGRDCIDIVNKVSEFLYTNGLNLLSEHDKLNIEGIGLAKSMVLFITKRYLAKEKKRVLQFNSKRATSKTRNE